MKIKLHTQVTDFTQFTYAVLLNFASHGAVKSIHHVAGMTKAKDVKQLIKYLDPIDQKWWLATQAPDTVPQYTLKPDSCNATVQAWCEEYNRIIAAAADAPNDPANQKFNPSYLNTVLLDMIKDKNVYVIQQVVYEQDQEFIWDEADLIVLF